MFFDRFKIFRDATGLLKDVLWWIAAAIAAATFLYTYSGQLWLNVTMHITASLLMLYAVNQLMVYRTRNKKLYRSFVFIHKLVHDLRDTLGEELKAKKACSDQVKAEAEVNASTKADVEVLSVMLQRILDSASHCFKEVTGHPCTSVLIMPEHDSKLGDVFVSRMYSNNASPERTQSSKPHRLGLIPMAFEATDVTTFPQLKAELTKGNFDKRGNEEPLQWYSSAMMCHFRVAGEKWGVLSIDSPTQGALRSHYAHLLCSFADALGLAFELSQLEILGLYVKPTRS